MSAPAPAPYILYVTANPACTEAIRYASMLGASQVQIINAHALQPPLPVWLDGVPTLISTQRPGPALKGENVVAWLRQAIGGGGGATAATQQRTGGPVPRVMGAPQQQQFRFPAPGATATPTTNNKQNLDRLFESEFDRQSQPPGMMIPAALSGATIQPQSQSNLGFEVVTPGTTFVSDVTPGERLTM